MCARTGRTDVNGSCVSLTGGYTQYNNIANAQERRGQTKGMSYMIWWSIAVLKLSVKKKANSSITSKEIILYDTYLQNLKVQQYIYSSSA